jgi:glycosyltransferase involved in cell wall biosynthesis
MLKVLCVVDKEKTALDRLAQGVKKYHTNINYKVLSVHPKRPDPQQLADFEREAKDADIIDWQYFRTAEKLRSMYPWLAEKKQILTHNNPYSIEEQDWNGYDINVGNNDYIYNRLGEITNKPVEFIPITVDSDFWTFNADWKPNKNVIMVANRIESKKGILPVAIACAELNLHFILVGAISDMNYFNAIMATTGNVEFHEQISDEELRDRLL